AGRVVRRRFVGYRLTACIRALVLPQHPTAGRAARRRFVVLPSNRVHSGARSSSTPLVLPQHRSGGDKAGVSRRVIVLACWAALVGCPPSGMPTLSITAKPS